MKKINLNFLKKMNKKVCLIICGIVVAIAVIATTVVLILNRSNEKELNKKLEELGISFYEDFYYDAVTKQSGTDFLAGYEQIGIKVSLDNLSRSKGVNTEEIIKFFVNSKTKKACDKDNTKVTIYPKEPYEKKDYKVEIQLECGFKK